MAMAAGGRGKSHVENTVGLLRVVTNGRTRHTEEKQAETENGREWTEVQSLRILGEFG